ncbi:MAG: FG-GAP-like repeat-containing protein [Planctomycetota bacterium]
MKQILIFIIVAALCSYSHAEKIENAEKNIPDNETSKQQPAPKVTLTKLENVKEAYINARKEEDLSKQYAALEEIVKKYPMDEKGVAAFWTMQKLRLDIAEDKEKEKEVILKEAEEHEKNGETSELEILYALAGYKTIGMPNLYNKLLNDTVIKNPAGLVAGEVDWYELRGAYAAIKDKLKKAEICAQYFKAYYDKRYARESLREFAAGMYEHEDNDFVKAQCEEILRVVPDNESAMFNIASIYLKRKMELNQVIDLSKTALDKVIKEGWKEGGTPAETQDNKLGYHIWLISGKSIYARALIENDKAEESVKFLLKSIEECSDNANIFYVMLRYNLWYALGTTYEKLGKADEAMDAYVQVMLNRGIGEIREKAESNLEALYKNKFGSMKDFRQYFHKLAGITTPVFTDVTETAGLADTNIGGRNRIAWGDFDGDGFEDILLTGSRLFRNKGDGTFENVTEQSGLNQEPSTGFFVDYDADGDLDIFAGKTNKEMLFRNEWPNKFVDVTKAVGIPETKYETEGCAAADFNGDGYLDFYVAKHASWTADDEPAFDYLFLNNGDATFTDVSVKCGLYAGLPGFGRGVSCADFDNDGDQDIYVPAYFLFANYLWQNDGKGNFVNVAGKLGVEGTKKPIPPEEQAPHRKDYYGHTVGAPWGDVDNDGDLDLFQTNLCHPDFRYVYSDLPELSINQGKEKGFSFKNTFAESGIKFEETFSDSSFCDYDADGDLDLYITSIYENMPTFLYQNDGTGHFTDVSWYSNTVAFDSWGHAWCDYDKDGDMDVAVGTCKGIKLFRNDGVTNSCIKIRLKGKSPNLDSIGARITVEANDKKYIREVYSSRCISSQDSLTQYIGLGSFKGTVSVTVRWPDGSIKTVEGLKINNPEAVEIAQ